MQTQPGVDLKNLVIAFAISVVIMFVWQLLMPPPPPPQPPAEQTTAQPSQEASAISDTAALPTPGTSGATDSSIGAAAPAGPPRSLDEALAASPRLTIEHPHLHGSIALKGLRFDHLTLADYRRTLDPNSPEVTLLKPSGLPGGYFAEFGWAGTDPSLRLPDKHSIWQTTAETLKPNQPVTLYWDNGDGLRFFTEITLDKHYMFTLRQWVDNQSGETVALAPFGLINHSWVPRDQMEYILHEGPFGVFNEQLEEIGFADMVDEQPTRSFTTTRGWLGISEKYWFTALIPEEGFTGRFTYHYHQPSQTNRYQSDYLAATTEIAPGATSEQTLRFYAGPKIVTLLDDYSAAHQIPLFDRAVDFGVLYFLTKPFYQLLVFFNGLLGNFGLAIMALTVLIRLVLFPLANKSYKSIAQMKALQPRMMELRERYADDKMRMNQEIMALYQKEKVNPMAGCLPILIQLPIFFALYKVLYVTIEMRHAPFFGWVHDLSAPDPTNIFTLFGLVPWNTPGFLEIGLWPIIMCITMVIQQRLNPPPSDPAQEKILKMLPYLFLFLFAHFAAGLVIYWAWNNTLSVLQQYVILRKHGDEHLKRNKKKALKAADSANDE